MIGGGCCCCLCVIFFIVMMATGFTKIETTEWCIKMNWWTQSVDEVVLSEPGMKFIGMGNYLIRYPNTNLNVYFRHSMQADDGMNIAKQPLSVRTRDGLTISLEMEFTYKLQEANLQKLYQLVGEEGWHQSLLFLSEGIIDNTATIFTAQEFYLNRTLIQNQLTTNLADVLRDKMFIDLRTLQLQPAHFPQKYSDSITQTQTWVTDVEVAQQEQVTKLIQKNTLLKTTKELADKVRVKAEAEAQEVMLNNNATVTQFRYRQKKEAEAYAQVLNFFAESSQGSSSTEIVGDLLTYMQTDALAQHNNGKKTIKIASAR